MTVNVQEAGRAAAVSAALDAGRTAGANESIAVDLTQVIITLSSYCCRKLTPCRARLAHMQCRHALCSRGGTMAVQRPRAAFHHFGIQVEAHIIHARWTSIVLQMQLPEPSGSCEPQKKNIQK